MALQDYQYVLQEGIPQLTRQHLRYLHTAYLNGTLPQALDDMAYLFGVSRATLRYGLDVAKGSGLDDVRNGAERILEFINMLPGGAWVATSTAAITAAEVSAGIAMAETGSGGAGILAGALSLGGRFFGALARLATGVATRNGAASLFGVVGLAAVLIIGGVIWAYNNPPARSHAPTINTQPGRFGTPIGEHSGSSAGSSVGYCHNPSRKALYTAYAEEVKGVVLCYCDCSIPGNCYGPPDQVCFRDIPPQYRPR